MAVPVDDVLAWPAWRQRRAVSARELSAVELVRASLERIEEVDPLVHSFVHVDGDAALAQAATLDDALRGGVEPGALAGVPTSVKDLFHVAGMPTSGGSVLFRDAVAETDSIHAARLRAAGAIIVGKTNTPEFGVFPRTLNLLQPETVNPWDLGRTSGGSSGGAAASVAAGLTAVAAGSDGGGSVRIPAALCGVSGMLPTRGLVPRHGGVGSTRLFSSVGPVATDARDLATVLQVLAGPLASDPFARADPPPDLLADLDAGVEGARIRWLESTHVADPDRRVREVAVAALSTFADIGAALVDEAAELDAGRWQDGFYSMMSADRYATIGESISSNPKDEAKLSGYARDAFARGRSVTGAQYSAALELRFSARHAVLRLFDDADLLLSPTTCIVAPTVTEGADPSLLVSFTNFCNFVGVPAATVPCGQVDGLPVGLQIVGRPGADALVLRAVRAFEQVHAFPRPVVGS